MLREQFHAPLRVAEMSFPQIEEQIKRCPSLIVPVGGLEPVGADLPIGAVNDCCEAIANALSIRLNVPVAPLMPYGSTIPFKAFGGSAGMHRDTMTNVITECCNCWISHGFQRIMILTLAMDGALWLEPAIKRLCALAGRKDSVRCCSLQDNERIRTLCVTRCGAVEHGRSEWGIRTLAGYLLSRIGPAGEQRGLATRPDAAQFKQWHRRGRDPEKLRKIAPEALFSSISAPPDAEAGRGLFEKTAAFLAEEFSPYLIVKEHASR